MISALGFVLINLLVDWSCRDWTPTPFTDRRCEMSTVDYTIAVRRRPEWRRVRLQPGLWLAWAVMIAALLMAIAPQWFTSSNPLEDPRRSAPAPQAHYWLGTDQLGRDLWTRVVYGAVHSLSAALIAVAIGPVVGTALGTLAGALAGRVESTIMRTVDVLLAIPPCCCSSR
nr:Probable D,D-dipeptide transport system permease protein ddpC [Klebsiella pneumoniae]